MSERGMNPSKERVWTVEPDEYGQVDPGALNEAALEAVAIIRRIGGVIYIGAQRVEVDDGIFDTIRAVFRWSSNVPRPKDEERESIVDNGTVTEGLESVGAEPE